jgi:hypothetical protein
LAAGVNNDNKSTTKKLKNDNGNHEKTMKYLKTLAVAAGLVCATASSQAFVVVADETSQLIQISSGPPGTKGAVVGSITSWVLSGVTPAGLTFVYQVVNHGPDPIDNIEVNGFDGNVVSATVVATAALPGALAPTPVGFPGVAFEFGGTVTVSSYGIPTGLVTPGVSEFLVVDTTATTYGPSTGQIQDGFSGQGATLAPSAVPEPTTVVAGALLLLPFGLSAFRSLRKDKSHSTVA